MIGLHILIYWLVWGGGGGGGRERERERERDLEHLTPCELVD